MRVIDVTVMSLAPKGLDSGLESLLEAFPQFRGEAPSCSEGAVNALHVILLSNPIEEDVRFLYRIEVSEMVLILDIYVKYQCNYIDIDNITVDGAESEKR